MTAPRAPLRTGRIGGLLQAATSGFVTPLVPADVVALVAPLLAGDVLRGRLVARTPEAGDAVTLTIRTGRGWRPHRPGQYVRIGVDIEGVRHWRAYSITSAPERRDGLITLTVRDTGGLVSGYLHHRAAVPSLVHLDVAAGDFVLPAERPDKVLFITGGSGVTPIIGMLRSYRFGDVVVVHSSRDAASAIFGPELRSRAAAGQLVLHEQHTGRDGRLTADRLAALVPDWRERETYVCGPESLLAFARETWAAAGCAERLHAESFAPVTGDVEASGVVTFSRSGISATAEGASTLLQTGEAAGVLLPSSCRAGICYTCVTPLLQGSVRDARTGAVTTAAAGDRVFVQTCVNAAAGPCTLDA